MSRLKLTKSGTPTRPAASKILVYADMADSQVKVMDGDTGLVYSLSNWDDNQLINGGFPFAQRQAPGTLTTYSNTTGRSYAADRWGMTNENASLQYQRIDTSAAIESNLINRHYGKFKKITTAGKFVLSQVMLGDTVIPFHGRQIRLQAKMKYSVASSMAVRLGLAQLTAAGTLDTIPATFISAFGGVGVDPTLGTNLAYIAPITGSQDGGVIVGNALSANLTSAWVRYSAAFTVPADCKNLVVLIWTNGQPAANDELNVSEVGFYDGPDINNWAASKQDEWARCRYFYQKTFPVDTAPAQSAGLAGSLRFPVTTAGAVATSIVGQWRFPTPMRVAPVTTTFYNPSAANAFARNVTLATDATATTAADAADNSIRINATGLAAWAVGNDAAIHATCDAEL